MLLEKLVLHTKVEFKPVVSEGAGELTVPSLLA